MADTQGTQHDIYINEEEMKSLSGVFTNCAEEAMKAGQAMYVLDSIINNYFYEGRASSHLPETMERIYSGLLRLSYLYEELSNFIDDTATSFKNVDRASGDAAKEIIVTGKNGEEAE